jgi:hypothetical protein
MGVTISQVREIAEVLECDWIWLLTGETPEPPEDFFAGLKDHSIIETNVRFSRIQESLDVINNFLKYESAANRKRIVQVKAMLKMMNDRIDADSEGRS